MCAQRKTLIAAVRRQAIKPESDVNCLHSTTRSDTYECWQHRWPGPPPLHNVAYTCPCGYTEQCSKLSIRHIMGYAPSFNVSTTTVVFFNHHFYFPALLVGGFALGSLLGKPWSQVSSLLPPGTFLYFLSRIGLSIPTARRFSSNVANSRSRAFR